MKKQRAHFTANAIINPANPVTVNLIGAGGTGSQMLTALARINHALTGLGHAGLQVTLFDDDTVTAANQGRQLFAEAEIGMNKSVALINRVNRFFGTDWKAMALQFCRETANDSNYSSNITISCVDTVKARFEIAGILEGWYISTRHSRNNPFYWMDFGNSQYTGQVLLSTIKKHEQPKSKKFLPVSQLPFVTEEFKTLLETTDEKSIPSCSLAEALASQDLFINSSLANLGASLLWQLFREGMIHNRGFFINLKNLLTQPIIV